jgi:Ser/Thr protein kinase RdoA (MazF antagonist)
MQAALRQAIEHRYGRHLGPAQRIADGDECEVWMAPSERGPLVIRLSPTWRTMEELLWVHELVRLAAFHVSVAIPPLAAQDHSSLFLYGKRPTAIFPFVGGEALDREDGSLRRAAARLLAQLHQVMVSRPPEHSRPAPGPNSPDAQPFPPAPSELADAELDRLEDGLARAPGTLSRGPLHGDYYPRNILCADGRITGIIDWDEATMGFLADELGWAAWEFCHSPSGDDLDFERAQAFVRMYHEAGGPCPARDNLYLIPFIRRRLRQEVRRSLAAEERGEPWDAAYREAEMRAFGKLKGNNLA